MGSYRKDVIVYFKKGSDFFMKLMVYGIEEYTPYTYPGEN